jgi:hypothetical protein
MTGLVRVLAVSSTILRALVVSLSTSKKMELYYLSQTSFFQILSNSSLVSHLTIHRCVVLTLKTSLNNPHRTNNNFVSYFVWVWNVTSSVEGGTSVKVFQNNMLRKEHVVLRRMQDLWQNWGYYVTEDLLIYIAYLELSVQWNLGEFNRLNLVRIWKKLIQRKW